MPDTLGLCRADRAMKAGWMYVPVLHQPHFPLARSLLCWLRWQRRGGRHDYAWRDGAGRGRTDLVGLHVSWGSCRDTREHGISLVTALSHVLISLTSHVPNIITSVTLHLPKPQLRRDSHHLGHHCCLGLRLFMYARFGAFLLKKSSPVLGNLICLVV